MTEIFFYHLERQPLEKVLPTLLEKTLERDWTAIVQSTTQERVEMIDELLWTYTAESFLPHAKDSEFDPEIDPIVITSSAGLAYSAEVLFLVDGALGLGIIVLKRLSFDLLLFFFILISSPTSKISLESNLQ